MAPAGTKQAGASHVDVSTSTVGSRAPLSVLLSVRKRAIDQNPQDAGIEPAIGRTILRDSICVWYRRCTSTAPFLPDCTSEGLRTDDIHTWLAHAPPSPHPTRLQLGSLPRWTDLTQICGSFSDSLIYFRGISFDVRLTFLRSKTT